MALGKTGQVVHRSGPLKQTNKPHKGGRSNDKLSKGSTGNDVCVLLLNGFSHYSFYF